MGRPNDCLREAVSDKVVLTRQVLDVRGELGDHRELTLPMPGPWLRGLGHGECHRFVVYEGCELPTLQQKPKVSGGEEEGQEFPVEGAVLPFIFSELLGEESQQLPDSAHPLLTHHPQQGQWEKGAPASVVLAASKALSIPADQSNTSLGTLPHRTSPA